MLDDLRIAKMLIACYQAALEMCQLAVATAGKSLSLTKNILSDAGKEIRMVQ